MDDQRQEVYDLMHPYINDAFLMAGGEGKSRVCKGEGLGLVGANWGENGLQPYAGGVGAFGAGPVLGGYETTTSGSGPIYFYDQDLILGGFGAYNGPEGYGAFFYVGPPEGWFVGAGVGHAR